MVHSYQTPFLNSGIAKGQTVLVFPEERLYPSNILPPETFDIENIKKYCLDTDDIWLKFMELKNNVKVVFTNSKVIHPLTIRHTQEDSLMQTNTKNENINDINIKNMEKFTGIKLGDVE